MKKKLHTPEGVRDIYNVECGKKLALESRLKKVFHLYGYHDIQTPTIEYFDVFREEIGTTPANDLYKFFDKDGNTLVLRPDITPSIARASATLFKDENLPIRLCSLSIRTGVIGVGIFCISARFFSRYHSLVRFTISSNVEPLRPLEFHVPMPSPLSVSRMSPELLRKMSFQKDSPVLFSYRAL